MSSQSILHIELYTSDLEGTRDRFVRQLGFTQVADSSDASRTSVYLRQGDVRLILTTGPATTAFVDEHGDGVADIALVCDDVPAVCHASERAGARVTTADGVPVVSGFGSVSHTLVTSGSADSDRLPHHRVWRTGASAPAPASGSIRILDHVAICVAAGTLRRIADFYGEVFGMPRYSSEYVDLDSQGMDSIVVRSGSGGVTFTLVSPDPSKPEAGQLDAFLERNAGPGVQHLAFQVDDIIGSVGRLQQQEVEFLATPGMYYDALAARLPDLTDNINALRATGVLADRDEYGDLLQIFTRSPFERNTLFFELIQRKGSRGFGSRNIRALYEAVERDRLVAE